MLTPHAYLLVAAATTLVARAQSSDSDHHSATRYDGLNSEQRDALLRIDQYGPYGYQPELAGAVVFCIVFGLAAIALTWQSVRGKRWWMLATLAFGAWCECVGNGIRIYGHFHTDVVDPYIAQQVILVLTPAFFAAAHFTILTKVCQQYGAHLLHPVRPSWLIPLFVVLDVASLGVQGAGSGLAAIAEIDNETVDTINGYGNIVVAGLAIQLLGYVAFNALFATFVVRALHAKRRGEAPWFDARLKTLLVATATSALFVLGRSAFRTAEMAIGWVGEVSTTEWYYLVFDATFVALAVLIMVVVSPASYLPPVEHINGTQSFHKGHSNSTSITSAADIEKA